MERIFVTVVNMSIAASWVIAAILLVRLILRRAPKVFLCPLGGSWLSALLSGFIQAAGEYMPVRLQGSLQIQE